MLTKIDVCLDLLIELFDSADRHARSAVSGYRLPANFSVEVDAIIRRSQPQ